MDAEPFERFENDFAYLWEHPDVTNLVKLQDDLIDTFGKEGYRVVAKLKSNYPESMSSRISEIYDEVEKALDEDGDVIFLNVGSPFQSGKVPEKYANAYLVLVEQGYGDESNIAIAKYYDGDYDYNQVVSVDKENKWWKQEQMEYLNLSNKQIQAAIQGEMSWVEAPALSNVDTDRYYIWMTNSVFLPQPWNMTLPDWLMKEIKLGLSMGKVNPNTKL